MNNYKIVRNIIDIIQYLGAAVVVAFDIETAPNDEYRNDSEATLDPHKSHISTLSLSVEEDTGIMIPVAHKSGNNIDPKEFWPWFRSFLTDTKVVKIAHNISYEAMFAYANGIIITAPVYDTMSASQLTLYSDFKYRSLKESGLKTLAKELFDEPLPSFEDVTGGRYFDELDPDDPETIRYSCADSDFALRLYHLFNGWFSRYLPNHRYVTEQIESPTAVYIGIMKHNGVPVDTQLMEDRMKDTEATIEDIKKKIAFIIGDIPIGANAANKNVKDYLFGTLRLPILKTTEKGSAAIDDQALQLLKEWCDTNRPELSELFILIQEYRKCQKIKTTYLENYRKHVNAVTGRIHPSFLALSTETGRLSCNSPNMQNMPRTGKDPVGIRDLIKAPEGYKIISVDFSQIELRVGAFYCRDEKMMQTYRDNKDIHAMTTSIIFGITYNEAKNKEASEYKERRSIAKNVNFGVFYGLYPKGLQQTLKFKAELDKTYEECSEIISNIKAGYPGLGSWQAEIKYDAARRIYAETWLGRRRYLPDINSSDWSRKSFAERCSMNTPIQGTAADIIKLAMGRIIEGLSEHMYLQPILQIHDELTFIVPEDKVDEAVRYIKECMEEKPFPEFDIPLQAEASVGDSFGSLRELN